jgi:hypothetical protein
MADNGNGKVWVWLVGVLTTVCLGLVVAVWKLSGGITATALATQSERIEATETWIDKHDEWAMKTYGQVLDSFLVANYRVADLITREIKTAKIEIIEEIRRGKR